MNVITGIRALACFGIFACGVVLLLFGGDAAPGWSCIGAGIGLHLLRPRD